MSHTRTRMIHHEIAAVRSHDRTLMNVDEAQRPLPQRHSHAARSNARHAGLEQLSISVILRATIAPGCCGIFWSDGRRLRQLPISNMLSFQVPEPASTPRGLSPRNTPQTAIGL